jgi:Family of unknown function (DUF6114)
VVTPGAGQDAHSWRRSRPFWGGLLLLLAGVELFLSANLDVGDLQVHFGPEGFLSYLLPLLLLLCGGLAWFSPQQRFFYGVLGLLTAVYALTGLNLGGFGLGTLLGILGGALTIAWGPPRKPRTAEMPAGASPGDSEPPAGTLPGDGGAAAGPLPGHGYTAAELPVPYGPAPYTGGTPAGPYPPGGAGDAAGEARPPEAAETAAGAPDGATDPAATAFLPRFDDGGEPPRPPSGGVHRLLAITLVPLAASLAAVLVTAQTPARADTCPTGVPSRPPAVAGAAAKRAPASKATRTAKPRATPARPKAGPAQGRSGAKPAAADDADPEPSGSATTATGGTGNPLVDGWHDLVDGVGRLLGLGGATPGPTAGPSGTPAPSATAPTAPSTPAATTPAPSASGPSSTGGTPGPADPGGRDGSAPSGAPASSPGPVPCLGERVFKDAAPGDTPRAAGRSGLLEGDELEMFDSTYDGVAMLPVAGGTRRVLKFSMARSVTTPGTLTVPEAGDATTVISTPKLTTAGHVAFYTDRFEGTLFGLFPVTFTPDAPPPLTVPYLYFTHVKINLALVQCDTLTLEPLSIAER